MPLDRPSRFAASFTLTLLYVVTISGGGMGFPSTGFAAGGRQGDPERPTEITFTLTADESHVRIGRDHALGFDRISYEGLRSYDPVEWTGSPMLPAFRDRVALPDGMRVARLLATPADPVVVATDVRPLPIPTGEHSDSTWVPDPVYYQEGNVFPPTSEVLSGNDGYRGIRLADVVVLPFLWDPITTNLILYRSLTVRLVLEPIPVGEAAPTRQRPERRFSREGHELRWVRQNVRNPEDFDRFYTRADSATILMDPLSVYEENHATGFHPTDRPSLEGPSIDMVIITESTWANGETAHGSLVGAFQQWADWRTQTGVPTVVRTLSWIRENYAGTDDPERIRKFLTEAYSLWGTDYLLLGGDVEVVPARILQYGGYPPGEYPTAWYYAELDANWSGLFGPGYNQPAGANYPELWVGRVPVRDSAEAQAYLAKLQTYERVPGLSLPIPADAYYSKSVLIAGFTNYGGWDQEDDAEGPPSSPHWWKNGVWQAERLKINTLDPVGFNSYRLYPKLTGTVACQLNPNIVVDCYAAQRAYFAPPNQPEADFTTANVYQAFKTELPSIVFHVEHSSRYGLGGLTNNSAFARPARDACFDALCDNTECTQWANLCYQQYKADNPLVEAFSREFLTTLSNGPAYFVGLSYGSQTGMYDTDSVAEQLVRDPDGGAVAFAGKVISANVSTDPDTSDMSGAFLREALKYRVPVGAALANGVGKTPDTDPKVSWHLFGDPTLRAWTAPPESLWLSSDVDTLGNPDFYDIRITARSGGEFGPHLPGVRVCLNRDDDIYALTWTDSSGVARFPSLLVASTLDGIDVWGIAHNHLPDHTLIFPANFTNLEDTPTLTYFGHTASDVERPGLAPDIFEAGDRVKLDVVLHNVSADTCPAAAARLVPTPRVRMALWIDGAPAKAEDVYIGRNGVHPPAEQDTFSLIVNEAGIRPERKPTGLTPTNDFLVWRSPLDFTYHVRTAYGDTLPTAPCSGTVIVDGGISLQTGSLDPEDVVTVQPDGRTIQFTLQPDESDDEVVFDALAPDWLTLVDDTDNYELVTENDTTICHFTIDLDPELPPRQRLNFTVVTRVGEPDASQMFSDFYFGSAAPDISFVLQEVQVASGGNPNCNCNVGLTRHQLKPTLINRGNADADSIEVELQWTGASVQMCPGGEKLLMSVPAGQEATAPTGFEFCDSAVGRTLRVEKLTLRRTVNGNLVTIGEFDPTSALNPWSIASSGVTSLTVKPTSNGFRAAWLTTGAPPFPIGYHVYVDSAGTISRANREMITEASQTWTFSQPHRDALGQPITYRIGVSRVTTDYVETPIRWSGVRESALQPRAGWPQRMPSGPVKSILAVDLDSDGDLEVLAGGRVLAAWNEDGSPLGTAGADGLLFNPLPDASVTDERFLYYWGEVSAADIDGDGKTEIAGMYGNGKLYVIEETGAEQPGFPRTVDARSTPTLADLDGQTDWEIVLNGYLNNDLYVFNADGTSFRGGGTSGLYASLGLGASQFNTSGVAVGDVRPALSGLEIAQAVHDGRVILWRSQATGSGNPPQVWSKGACDLPPCAGPVSTPVIGDLNGNNTADVTFASQVTYRKVVALKGNDGSRLASWRGRSPSQQDGTNQWHWVHLSSDAIQWPALAEMNSAGNDMLEVVMARQFFPPDYTPGQAENTSMTKTSLLHWRGAAPSGSDPYGWISTPADTIPLPGRRQEVQGVTRGNPVVADIDSDGLVEMIAPSNHTALFAWEATPAPGDSFTVRPKLGWPIGFSDIPTTPVIADLGGYGDTMQLIVGTDDGFVYVYDLPGITSADVQWPMSGFDSARSNNFGNYTSGFVERESAGDVALRPGRLYLSPNPVETSLRVRFVQLQSQSVRLAVYDVGGRLVDILHDGPLAAGDQEFHWILAQPSQAGVAAGVYFVRLSSELQTMSRRVVVNP